MHASRVFASLLAVTALASGVAGAQQTPVVPGEPAPIEDNSFLVEEAYNQERGVVQHVSTFSRAARGGGWASSFTQEWPVASLRHQLSYTIPVSRTDAAADGRSGVGDVALNYRYQVGNGEGEAVAFAPRATLLLPTGSSGRGLGAGGAGAQVNLPLSVILPASLVVHSNVGATYTPRARDGFGARATTVDYLLGQSVVWLARPKLNVMLEAVWLSTQSVAGPGRAERSSEFLVAPGLRGAIDFKSGLQVVPGLAIPIGVGPSRGERQVYVYLSLEHAFVKASSHSPSPVTPVTP